MHAGCGDYIRDSARQSLTCIKERPPPCADHRQAGQLPGLPSPPKNDMESDITLDVCGLEPPEPLERVLEALSDLPKGRRLRMLIDREPRPLYRILQNNGFL